MQLQDQPESESETKKRYLMTISSLNKAKMQSRNKNYKTLDKHQRLSMGAALNSSAGEYQLISTKIINVQLNSQLLNSVKKGTRQNQSFTKIKGLSSERDKNRYDDRSRQIYRKGKGGVRVIAKYKYPIPDERTPMKKYIKIEQIKLPTPDPSSKNSSIKIKAMQSPQFTEKMKQTIEQYNRYIQKNRDAISSIAKSKIHKRNFSSIIQPLKSTISQPDESTVLERPMRKIQPEEFSVRRPLGRKDYFVFGMSDRNNPQNKVQYYRDFLWKINFSNSLNVFTPEQVNNPYRAYIGPGNNYHLVKSVLKRRFWWTIVQKTECYGEMNFLWTQLKQNTFFSIQEKSDFVIIPEQKYEWPTLHKSDSETTKQPTLSASQQDFHKKLFSKSDLVNWNKHVSKNERTEEKISELTYVKRLSLYTSKDIRNIQNSGKLKVHNHLESNFFIGNKKALFYNMRKYLTLKNVDPFTILPLTFHIAKGTEDPDFKAFKKYYEEIEANKNTTGLRNMWIVKPGENTNRGNGITVAYSLDDVIVRLKGRQRNNDGKLRTFIIQKYIQRPLLYFRRKFDIRHYMLITCTNGIFKAYWYEEGYIRTSSSQFTTKYSKDPFVHLTNDAIQKNGANYGKYEKGNKLSYQDFQKYIETYYKNKRINFFDHILPEMKHIASQSVRSTYAILDESRREHNFQLLGLDFMIDEDFKPWLIQVNTNPCLELSCSLLEKIIPQLIDNVFRICIDPLFPPPESWQSGKKIYFGDSPLSENKFEIIFDQYDDGQQIQKLYKGCSKLDEKMGKIQEDDEIFEDDGDQNWQTKK